MNLNFEGKFGEFQKSWQSQAAASKTTINTNLLLQEAKRSQRQFWATIFWRDVREVGVAAVLVVLFSYHGWRSHDWTDYLIAVACLGVGAFIVADRRLQCKKRPVPHDDLKSCIETSLAQVNHQVWLLKNVLWWYLLPIAVALEISTWHSMRSGHWTMIGAGISAVGVVLLYWGIYWLNRYVVRKNLEPRSRELKELLAALNLPP